MPLTDFTWRFIEKLPNRTNKNFIIKSIPKVFVEKELRALRRKKATGLDELPPGLLKDCAAFYYLALTKTHEIDRPITCVHFEQ